MPYENVLSLGYTWIPEKLYLQLKSCFEIRYSRNLNDQEIVEIADNLTSFIETTSKLSLGSKKHEQKQSKYGI